MKMTTITIKHNGSPAIGAVVTIGDPFNKKVPVDAEGKISKNLEDDFATVTGMIVRYTPSGQGEIKTGVSNFEIVAGEDYIIEV